MAAPNFRNLDSISVKDEFHVRELPRVFRQHATSRATRGRAEAREGNAWGGWVARGSAERGPVPSGANASSSYAQSPCGIRSAPFGTDEHRCLLHRCPPFRAARPGCARKPELENPTWRSENRAGHSYFFHRRPQKRIRDGRSEPIPTQQRPDSVNPPKTRSLNANVVRLPCIPGARLYVFGRTIFAVPKKSEFFPESIGPCPV